MTENERIAKVLGWERKPWSPDIDRDGEEFGHAWYRHDGSRVADPDTKRDEENYEGYLPDWPNDIAACVRDLVPWAESQGLRLSLMKASQPGDGELRWRVFFASNQALMDSAWGDTPAAAICAAFLAAFEETV